MTTTAKHSLRAAAHGVQARRLAGCMQVKCPLSERVLRSLCRIETNWMLIAQLWKA